MYGMKNIVEVFPILCYSEERAVKKTAVSCDAPQPIDILLSDHELCYCVKELLTFLHEKNKMTLTLPQFCCIVCIPKK